MVGRAFTWKNKPDEYADGFRKESGEVSIMTFPGVTSTGVQTLDTPPRPSRTFSRVLEEFERLYRHACRLSADGQGRGDPEGDNG